MVTAAIRLAIANTVDLVLVEVALAVVVVVGVAPTWGSVQRAEFLILLLLL